MDPESPCRVNHTCNRVSDVGASFEEIALIPYGFEGPSPREGRIVASFWALGFAWHMLSKAIPDFKCENVQP